MGDAAHAGAAGGAPGADTRDGQGVSPQGGLCPQGLHTAQGGLDVLGHGHIGKDAFPPGQSCGEDQPVGLAFGGRGSDGPL